mgnify:CR=1 FL=1
MKKIIHISLCLFLVLGLTSCFEDIDKTWDEGTLVEFQQSIIRTPAVGRTFPLIAVNNGAGEQLQQINLVGPQRGSDVTVKVSVDKEFTTATEGTHFSLADGGNVTFPANSSTANAKINILRATGTAGQTFNVVLILEGNGSDIKPSENYKRVGYTIRL